MSVMELSIVICNGRPAFPFATVQSIQTQATSNVEIIVVSNNPRSRWTLDDCSDQLRVVCAMNTKANVSRNLGANIATGDYILFLDDDVTIAPDFIEKTIKFVRSRADGAISRLRIGQKDIGIIFNENGLLIRREIISKYPFDETLGPGTLYASSEALDLKIRLARAGIRLVESEALVLHPPLIESVTAEKVFLYAVGNSIVALRYGQVSNLLLEMCKCIAKGFLNIFGLKKRHSFVRQRLAGLIAGTILYEKNTLDR